MIQTFQRVAEYFFCVTYRQFTSDYRDTVTHLQLQVRGRHEIHTRTIYPRELDVTVPFVYITAKSMKDDMKLGYEIGADDYIVKPFDSELLIFKIKAILSRCEHEETEVKPKLIELGAYLFNTELRTITKGDDVIKLTPKESRLLELLYYHRDGLLQRDKALNEIWGASDYFTARSMDVYVTKLRKYFKDDPAIKIENVHGSGFRLILEEK